MKAIVEKCAICGHEDISNNKVETILKGGNKATIYRVNKGVKFLGYKIFPYSIHLKTENIQRFKKRMKTYRIKLRENKVQFIKIKQSIASWNGQIDFLLSYEKHQMH